MLGTGLGDEIMNPKLGAADGPCDADVDASGMKCETTPGAGGQLCELKMGEHDLYGLGVNCASGAGWAQHAPLARSGGGLSPNYYINTYYICAINTLYSNIIYPYFTLK